MSVGELKLPVGPTVVDDIQRHPFARMDGAVSEIRAEQIAVLRAVTNPPLGGRFGA
jgi:hypothetical protein